MADAQKSEKSSHFQEVELAHVQKSEKSFQTNEACTDNGKDNTRVGIGVFLNDEDDRNVSEVVPFEKPQTNGFAEFYAI